jgi:hypothetical protein
MVILPIDTINSLFKDYCGQIGYPKDALPVKLMYKPTELGKLAIVVESDEFTGPQGSEQIKFDIRRYYGVG